jgi:hypothetical protein
MTTSSGAKIEESLHVFAWMEWVWSGCMAHTGTHARGQGHDDRQGTTKKGTGVGKKGTGAGRGRGQASQGMGIGKKGTGACRGRGQVGSGDGQAGGGYVQGIPMRDSMRPSTRCRKAMDSLLARLYGDTTRRGGNAMGLAATPALATANRAGSLCFLT